MKRNTPGKHTELNSPGFVLDKEAAVKLSREIEQLSDEEAGMFIKFVLRFTSNEDVELDSSFRKLFENLIWKSGIETAQNTGQMSALDRAIAYNNTY